MKVPVFERPTGRCVETMRAEERGLLAIAVAAKPGAADDALSAGIRRTAKPNGSR